MTEFAGLAGVVTAACGILVLAMKRSVHSIGKGEQLRVIHFTQTTVHNGPKVKVLNPLGYRSLSIEKGTMLGAMDFVKVEDMETGKVRIARGPQLFFLGPYEKIGSQGSGTTLGPTEYLTVIDQISGKAETVKGPRVWYPGEYDRATSKKTAIALQQDEYIRIKDQATGTHWIERGAALVFLEPTWQIEGGVNKAWTLKSFEYIRLLDASTGMVTVHRGEKVAFPGPNEELLDGKIMTAIDLAVNEYVKIVEQSTNEVRIVTGPSQVFLGSSDKVVDGGKKRGVQVDEEHAVLVRDKRSGELRLETTHQLFVPGPHDEVEEERKLYKLADHEAMIVKDKGGVLHFHYGNAEKQTSDAPRSFFLAPYTEIVQLWWSSGLRRLKRDLCIERFDTRPNYMWFEFDCRTSDNVELILETTFFWEVTDLAKMIATTGNLPGDIYNKARSQFIKQVARYTLKSFMDGLHVISDKVYDEGKPFFESRGVRINSLDVTRYHCAEKRTSEVLQQIIEETTNRLNRLSQAESENEVQIFRMQGQIEQEKLNSELIKIQHEHTREEAAVSGMAEAEQVVSFVKGLKEEVPNLEDRLMMWQVLRKTDALSVVSKGGASLVYTPSDVDLKIGMGTKANV